MCRTKNIIDGLEVLLKYYDNQEGCHNGAEHDAFYADPTDEPLWPEDVRKMIVDFGWTQEYEGRDYGEAFSIDDYQPDESWVFNL